VRGPLEPPPHEHAGWAGRWDDPDRRFRTLYVASDPRTAIREVLAPLRPDAAMVDTFGAASREVQAARRLPLTEHDRSRRLASATVRFGAVADVATVGGRLAVAERYADVLTTHGVAHLDDTDVTTRDRGFTRALARSFYDDGLDGVRYASNIDGGECLALFEGRYELTHEPTRHVVLRPSEAVTIVREAVVSLGLVVVP
jgi:hypothetical protein